MINVDNSERNITGGMTIVTKTMDKHVTHLKQYAVKNTNDNTNRLTDGTTHAEYTEELNKVYKK